MKKILAILLVVTILALGCISEKEEPQTPPPPPSTTTPAATTPPQTTPASTTPPPTTPTPTTTAPTSTPSILGDAFNPIYKDRMWSTYKVIAEGEESQMTFKMFEGSSIFVLEYGIETEGMIITAQMWLAKTKESPYECDPIKYIMKMGGMVYCTDTMTFSNPVEDYTPEEYADYPVVREGTYTTSTGKMVSVFVVIDGKDEYWFSNEVPFSIVKIISDGKLSLSLNDFGFNAERKISQEEGEQCIPVQSPSP